MNIRCVPSEGKRGVLTLLIDEEPFREIHTTVFGRRPNLPKASTREAFEEEFHILEARLAKNYAYKRLSLKNQPSTELSKALRERFIPEKVIESIVQECQTLGYINDNEWVEGFVRQQVVKNNGPRTIEQKLKAKGIPSSQIEQALSTSIESQSAQITQLLNTRYKSRDLADYKEKQKVIASLLRKGFHFEEIQNILSTFYTQDDSNFGIIG